MSSSRQGRANQRQTPLPADVLIGTINGAPVYEAREHTDLVEIHGDPGRPMWISSLGGRRGGLIPTAPIDPASNHLRSVPALEQIQSNGTQPWSPHICITCGLGPRPGHTLNRIDNEGGYVHRHGCPPKRIPPPPKR